MSEPGETYMSCPNDIDYKKVAKIVKYDDLFRNNEKYIGLVVHFSRAELVQIIGDKGYWELRANVTKKVDYYTDTVYLDYYGDTRFLEDDIVEFWGLVKGIKRYTAVLGNEIQVPEIEVIEMKLKS